jgi:hypothetical protein
MKTASNWQRETPETPSSGQQLGTQSGTLAALRRVVVALYIDPRGPYPALPFVSCYGLREDARAYDGDAPVVAHPPCGPWSSLRHLYRGSEHDCGPRAVDQVQRWGGVLEHPAHSALWAACGLPLPGHADAHGYTVEVCQCDWGHVARKRTWLYLVGVPRSALQVPPSREPTHWASGSRTAKRGPVPAGIKVCSAQQRRRTPPEFARYLVSLARASRVIPNVMNPVASANQSHYVQ